LDLRDVVRPGPSRGLDFVKLDELSRRTGIEAKDALSFALSELLCNAPDLRLRAEDEAATIPEDTT
jgi:hypothetical protein